MGTNIHRGPQRSLTRIYTGVVLIVLGLVATTELSFAREPAGEEKQAVVTVQGMQCPFCAYGIKKHLGKLPGATRIDIELATNQATVTFEAGAEVTDEEIEEAVRKAGFTPGDIRWRSGGDKAKEKSDTETAAKVDVK